MPKPIEAIIADIDGTLISGGNLHQIDPLLRQYVGNVRYLGILFTLSSGRCFPEQHTFFKELITPNAPKQNEGILYEESALRLFDRHGNPDKPIVLGGLTLEQVEAIHTFADESGLYEGLVDQDNSLDYQHMIGFVTLTFITDGITDSELLRRKHLQIKDSLEKQFPFLEVTRSADAVDIKSKGVSKANQVQVYSEKTGIPLEQMAYFGDSGNDLPAMSKIGLAGGYVVYVGTDQEHEEEVRQLPNYFISEQRGPLGTVCGLANIIAYNQKIKTGGK